MKTFARIILALLVVAALQADWAAASAAAAGKEAPDFSLKTHDGKTLTLSKLEGKRGAVLVFFATWCPACMAEVPQVKKFVEASRDKGVLVYGVNVQQPLRVIKKFVKERGINYRILLDADGAVSRAYSVSGIPLIVGIDGDGVIRYREHQLPPDAGSFIDLLTKPLAKAPSAKPEASKVSAVDRETLQQWRKTEKNLVIVDVLPPAFYHRAHIKGAINIPLAHLKSLRDKLPRDAKIVTYCASFKCRASTKAAKELSAWGYKDVHDYEGGIADWLAGDLPATKGKAISFIDKDTLQKWIQTEKNLVIVDVLSAKSYKQAHIKGAVNIPFQELEKRAGEIDQKAKVVTYCANYVCHASSAAAEKLTALGFTDVHDYKGGIHEWRESGLPFGGAAGK